MHQVCTYETGKLERPSHSLLSSLGQTQDQVGDQGDGDLDADGIFRDTDEVLDSQGLLDPAEEQFDLPALFVEIGNLLCRSVEVVGDDAQHLAAIDGHLDLPYRNLQWVLAAV